MNDLTDVEIQIVYMLRKLDLFDKLEIKYSKKGEIQWQLIKTYRGDYTIDID